MKARITNGTMEADANWGHINGATNAQDSTKFYSGENSWKFTVDAQYEGITSAAFAVTNGVIYQFTAWVYPDDTTNVWINVKAGNGSTNIINETVTGLTENAWNSVVMDYKETVGGAAAPPSLVTTAPKVYVPNASGPVLSFKLG